MVLHGMRSDGYFDAHHHRPLLEASPKKPAFLLSHGGNLSYTYDCVLDYGLQFGLRTYQSGVFTRSWDSARDLSPNLLCAVH